MSTGEYLRRGLEDAYVLELRHQLGARWHSGLFDRLEPLQDVIRDQGESGNLYLTLNRPRGVTATNRMGTRALRDADVEVICRIPFDFDPARPAGTAATEGELAAAGEARNHLVHLLLGYGWPMPAIGMSGNGAHAVYRTRIRSTPEWRAGAAILYAGLREQLAEVLADLRVTLDPSVRNPARIWRCYGSTNRKGTPTPERPHRTATIRLPAGAWQTVPAAVLSRTVGALRPAAVPRRPQGGTRVPVNGRGDYGSLDVVRWFEAHGAYRRDLGGGKHAVVCPWVDEHTTIALNGTDSVVWERGDAGWPTFHCSHSHCDGRTLRDVIALWGDADRFCSQGWRRG